MKPRTLLIAALLATAPMATLAPAAHADQAPVYTSIWSNIAVEGYDAVAYFTESKPVTGKSAYSTTYNGAEFRFATAENLATFEADPAKYAPQYGGYCAWAIAEGKFAKGSGKHWAIVDGKLYLNYNKSVQKTWNTDREGFINKANDKWPALLEK